MGQQQLQLSADSCHFFNGLAAPLALWCVLPGTAKYCLVGTAASEEEKEGCRQQFVQQVEALLYPAYKLQLPQLQRVMRQCISCNSCFQSSLLNAGTLRAVASARVLDAAGGCGVAQDAFIAICGCELGTLGGNFWASSSRQLLRPLDPTPDHQVRCCSLSSSGPSCCGTCTVSGRGRL